MSAEYTKFDWWTRGIWKWEVGMRPPARRGLRLRPGGKAEKKEGGKDRRALRLRSTSFEERPGGLEKKGGKGEKLEVGSRNAEGGKTGSGKSDPSSSDRAGLCRG
jgi:hypothetical protein